jgi:hypothetical protein
VVVIERKINLVFIADVFASKTIAVAIGVILGTLFYIGQIDLRDM